MRLKNVLITVTDVEKAAEFYRRLFGLYVISRQEGNVMLTGGLVLQERKLWQEALGREVTAENNCSLLYFEDSDLEGFRRKLEEEEFQHVKVLASSEKNSWGRKIIRLYDPDGNLIEVCEVK